MTPEILLVPSSVTLVPGVTGRSEVALDERDALVGTLARALATAAQGGAAVRGATNEAPDGIPDVRVVVVAPAPVSSTRTTDDGVPDLGAVGVVDPTAVHLARPVTAGPGPHGVRLHVSASVVTILLRLAGWRGPIRTVEIGGEEEAPGGTSRAARSLWAGQRDGADDALALVVVFTTLSGHGSLTGDSEPSGVPEVLRRADRAVAALYREAASGS